ncbi:MAG: hypothetical protein AYL32_007800 [Candidatus Bathyarchaeota archaeon B26-2]|nr:MAG: hypothetical protein AYL32_007800 [Candidatus Bathyarchaeota archaeon B26-2]
MRSLIFKDRSKLSPYYIPAVLPHREKQIQLLGSIYMKMLDDIDGAYPVYTQIVGSVGTGKTCTTLRFGRMLTEEAERRGIRLEHVYMNCKVDGSTRFVLFGNLVKKVAPELSTRSLSGEEMLHRLVEYLKDRRKYVFISFDESSEEPKGEDNLQPN